jgi:hypothetical protein
VLPSTQWIPASKSCEGNKIKIKDSNIISSVAGLTLVLTTTGLFMYELIAFMDLSDTSVDDILYRNYRLQNCSITSMTVSQYQTPMAIPRVPLTLFTTD